MLRKNKEKYRGLAILFLVGGVLMLMMNSFHFNKFIIAQFGLALMGFILYFLAREK